MKVKPDYTFPFTSAQSQYVVRGYRMTETFPSRGRPGHATLAALEMTFLLDQQLHPDSCLLYHSSATHSDGLCIFSSPDLSLHSPGWASTLSYTNYEELQLKRMQEP